MKDFDFGTISYLNQFARKSWVFDEAVAFLSVNHLLKGGVLMAFFWWAWFMGKDSESAEREHMIATLISCVIALTLGRLMVIFLPFRERPLHEERLDFLLPHGVDTSALDGLSSFPSDHAVLFFALVTGLFFISRGMGLLALFYVSFFIALPRIYLGLHYPSDILAGALVGVVICLVGNKYLPQRKIVQRVKSISYSAPMYFYPLLFLVTYQIADLFENSRSMVSGMVKMIRAIAGS
jgi:undecaprenyl-diphosphatase